MYTCTHAVHTQSHIESLSTSQLSQHCFADYLLTPLAHRKEAAQPEATVATPLEGGNSSMCIASTIIVLIFGLFWIFIGLDELGGGTGISSASVTERPLPTCSYPSLSGAHTGKLNLTLN